MILDRDYKIHQLVKLRQDALKDLAYLDEGIKYTESKMRGLSSEREDVLNSVGHFGRLVAELEVRQTPIRHIVYYTISGNTKAFAERFTSDGFEIVNCKDAANIDGPFIMFTPTYNFGMVPVPVKRLLDGHSDHLRAVVSFGNKNWGAEYALAGDKVSDSYGVPLLRKVEMRGNDSDYRIIKERLDGGFG